MHACVHAYVNVCVCVCACVIHMLLCDMLLYGRLSTNQASYSVFTVLEIRSKCRMDKCPSTIILGQTISDLLEHILEKYTYATVDVHQQIIKA